MFKQIAIPFFFLIVMAFTVFAIYRMIKSRETRYSKKRAILSLLFIWYLCGVAAMTIVPIRASRTQDLEHHFNFVPVLTSYHRYFYVEQSGNADAIRVYYGNLFGNVLLFIPLGIFLPLLYQKKFKAVVVIGAISSSLIEFIQYLNMHWGYYRYVDVDDVILNTLGAIVGYWIFKRFFHAGKYTRL